MAWRRFYTTFSYHKPIVTIVNRLSAIAGACRVLYIIFAPVSPPPAAINCALPFRCVQFPSVELRLFHRVFFIYAKIGDYIVRSVCAIGSVRGQPAAAATMFRVLQQYMFSYLIQVNKFEYGRNIAVLTVKYKERNNYLYIYWHTDLKLKFCFRRNRSMPIVITITNEGSLFYLQQLII